MLTKNRNINVEDTCTGYSFNCESNSFCNVTAISLQLRTLMNIAKNIVTEVLIYTIYWIFVDFVGYLVFK